MTDLKAALCLAFLAYGMAVSWLPFMPLPYTTNNIEMAVDHG